MSAKRKLLISMLSIVFILLAVVGTIAITFALTQQNFKTSLNIGYTVEDIDGSVYATYTIGGTKNYLEPIADAEHVSADNRSLIFKTTDTESAGNLMFPEGQLPLTAQNDNIVIQYTYTNTGVKHYIASMSFDAELTYSNMKVEYSINGVDYSTNRYAVVVPAFSTGKSYWIRISIDDKAQDASFTGDFNWLLSGCDPQSKEYLSLTSLEMQSTGTTGEYKVSVESAGEYAGQLVFPDNVNGDTVTKIVENLDLTEEEKDQITSIYIPASVETIEREAFSGYTSLQTVIFEEYSQLTTIEPYTFAYCENLTNIVIPDGVTVISGDAFCSCTSLTSIEIPSSVTWIDLYAFTRTGLTSIEIPEGVFISGSAFANCKDLTSVTIGSGVTMDTFWDGNVFYGCTNLKNATLETMDSTVLETLGELGSENGEMHITIGNSVSSIAEPGLFSGYSGITSIEVAEGNTVYHSVGNCVIESASKTLVLACGTYEIPTDGSVISIGNYACLGKPDNIVIPTSVTSIGMGAFAFCELTSLEVASGNTKYHSAGNCVIETASKTLVSACNSSVIPTDGSVTSIGDYAFALCLGLNSIEIPDNITSIGDYAFTWCLGLTSIEISNNVTSIGDGAFSLCGITSIVIPASVTSIGQEAFANCGILTSVTFENTVGWKIEDVEGDEGIQDVSSDVLSDPALLAQTLVEGTNYVWTRS